jgi:hypothetical protein
VKGAELCTGTGIHGAPFEKALTITQVEEDFWKIESIVSKGPSQAKMGLRGGLEFLKFLAIMMCLLDCHTVNAGLRLAK